ncbi:MAG TPA: serine/threonine-protein kinase, partial [Gemmatimonadaceae bacterium]|nr:serine/threonine-protein kinase [Gemmatimonadaceae bacterium]
PFIPGESLKSALEKHGPLSVRDVVRVLYDVIDALAYAHEHGVVHRDIKPANILRSGSHALVTDFGVAKAIDAARSSTPMTSTGMAIGTPAYMAPEQLAGDPSADHRIDIYAVGLLAYELLSGKSPFVASSPQGVLAAVLTRDPTPLVDIRDDVPQRLSDVIMECLSKVPGGRPPTAEALMVALDMFSTASGEIRTREHRVPMTPVAAVPVIPIPARAQPGFVVETPPPPFAGAAVPRVLAPLPQTIAPAAEVTSMARDDTISRREPRIADDRSSGRGKILVAGLALLLLAGTGAVLMSQRGGENTPIGASELSNNAIPGAPAARAIAAPAAAAPAGVAIPVEPRVTTAADSLAIEAAVQRQLAQAVAAARAAGTATNTAAVKQRLQRQLTDSVARANTPRTAAVAATQPLTQPGPQPVAPAAAAVASPIAPDATAAAPEPSGKRRLAIADPRQVRDRSELNAFSRVLVDALRASLGNGEAFALIDQDSVRDVLGRTNTREEAARLIKPDVLVSPAYVGAGDTVNVVVTVWDLRSNSSFGIRVTSTRLVSSNPEPYLAPIVQSVMKQLDDLARAPTIYRKR